MLTYFDDVVGNFSTSRAAAYMCVHKLNSLAEIHSVASTFEWGTLLIVGGLLYWVSYLMIWEVYVINCVGGIALLSGLLY